MLRQTFQYYCCAIKNRLQNRIILSPNAVIALSIRGISTELATALRPFYFVVHPDLFGQHPKERSVNEDSLKLLSAHMEVLHERKYHALREKKTLRFYIRQENSELRNNFKLITLVLDGKLRDPKAIILRLLELCNLSTDYIKSLDDATLNKAGHNKTMSSQAAQSSRMDVKANNDYEYGAEFMEFELRFREAKQQSANTLDTWMEQSGRQARERIRDLQPLKEEVERLRLSIVERLKLKDIRYDCGWNFEHFRGCLKTLERLEQMHPIHMQNLQHRIVVFASFTGISLEGHAMLFTGDVLNNWIDFIKNIPAHEAFVKKIPNYENTLAQVLCNIQIARRKFMPKQQAKEYASHLVKLTTTLGDYLSQNKYPKSWPASLKDYEIVVESEAGPLTVSPTGQLIVPSACPAFMFIDFITTNLPLAKERMETYAQEKHIERQLIEQTIKHMKLNSLTKEDSITPDKMIKTLTALLNHSSRNPMKCQQFEQLDLHITNYYSVLADGIVCIPWNFDTQW